MVAPPYTVTKEQIAAYRRAPKFMRLTLSTAAYMGIYWRILDPDYSVLYELSYGGVNVMAFSVASLINGQSGATLAKDKYCTYCVLDHAGLGRPRTVLCLRPGEDPGEHPDGLEPGPGPGLDLAQELGYPLVVKPNHGAQGRDVVVAEDEFTLLRLIEQLWRRDTEVLVQAFVPGHELRLDFFDGAFHLGYQVAKRPGADPRGPTLNIATRGARYEPLTSIPEAWERHYLRVGEVLGLRHYGIDLRGASLDDPPEQAMILDVNASPLHPDEWEESLYPILQAVFADRGVEVPLPPPRTPLRARTKHR